MFLLVHFAREGFCMKDPEQVRGLLGVAERDLSALRAMGDNPDFADEIFGFHAQQTAEKAFKVWLTLLGEEYPLTHDLAWLLEILKKHGVQIKPFECLIDYNPYAVQSRYLVDPNAKPIDRKVALKNLEGLMKHVRSIFADLCKTDGDE